MKSPTEEDGGYKPPLLDAAHRSPPLWILERTASTYWALYWHFAQGGYPFGDKILSKGIERDWISAGRVAAEAAPLQPNE